ncbi:hypothetical protein PRN20_08465 [Devosia sp. ZB163]|uniref:hypothetical protein n=1 Tax=Devosia sp. ZB163 TaxID=3025938 RepID=UPI002360204C|nr:hypothetical protein [Devosia sp. ZB163]MDC9823764.1 hypothetical protein [Devosia sp. ZB163]
MRTGLLLGLLWIALAVPPAMGQAMGSKDACAPFTEATKTPGAVPDELLADMDTSVPCLMGVLGDLAKQGAKAELVETERDKLNRATAALGKLISAKGVPAIDQMRALDTTEIASLLSFGARSGDYATRVNSTMLLSNIVDNSTVCVVMDHLADPQLTTTEGGKNGRANLLSVASVVAPWAMRSNYANMQKLLDYVEEDIVDETDVAQTTRIVAAFKERLAFQEKVAVPNRNIDSAEARRCNEWPVLYDNSAGFRIQYPVAAPPSQ